MRHSLSLQPAYIRRIGYSLTVLTFFLGACAGQPAAGQELSGAAAFAPESSSIPPSPAPTYTAVVFEMKPTGTLPPTRTPSAVNLTNGTGPADFPFGINPLTGLPVSDPLLLERRPMAIKVTNFPRSVRPQWGLTLADNVFEYYLEDGLSRFIGVFYSQDASRVGPIRSGRFFDEHIARMYKSILVFAYADDRVIDQWADRESDIRNQLVIERPDNCPPMCRIGAESNYNTLFTNTAQLSQYITERGTSNDRQNLNGFYFNRIFTEKGLPATNLRVFFSRISHHVWEYDSQSRRYFRLQETHTLDEDITEPGFEPLVDSLTGQQLWADNIVVLLMPYEQLTDTTDTEIYKVGFLGRGTGYAFREGKGTPVTWERENPGDLVSLHQEDGELYAFRPGNVWFIVLGQTSDAAGAEDGSWRFYFHTP